MVEANQNDRRKVVVKHFPIDEKNSFMQTSVTMPEEDYNGLLQACGGIAENPGKGKILI